MIGRQTARIGASHVGLSGPPERVTVIVLPPSLSPFAAVARGPGPGLVRCCGSPGPAAGPVATELVAQLGKLKDHVARVYS